MSYGLLIENPSGQLVVSSDGLFPGYLGKATLVSTVQDDGATSGYSTFTFSHAAQIIPVLKLVDQRSTFLQNLSFASGVWTILVHHAGSPSGTEGFKTQYAPEVFVWGVPAAVSGWGMAIYDATGNPTGDLTKKPLIVAQQINWTSTDGPEALAAGITTPGIIGQMADWRRQSFPVGATWNVGYDSGAWFLNGTDIARSFSRIQWWPTEDTDLGGTALLQQAATALIVDVAGLT